MREIQIRGPNWEPKIWQNLLNFKYFKIHFANFADPHATYNKYDKLRYLLPELCMFERDKKCSECGRRRLFYSVDSIM